MEILIEKGHITSSNVTSLKQAFAGLGKYYADRLHQPLDAYIKYASKYLQEFHFNCAVTLPVELLSYLKLNLFIRIKLYLNGRQEIDNMLYKLFVLSVSRL